MLGCGVVRAASPGSERGLNTPPGTAPLQQKPRIISGALKIRVASAPVASPAKGLTSALSNLQYAHMLLTPVDGMDSEYSVPRGQRASPNLETRAHIFGIGQSMSVALRYIHPAKPAFRTGEAARRALAAAYYTASRRVSSAERIAGSTKACSQRELRLVSCRRVTQHVHSHSVSFHSACAAFRSSGSWNARNGRTSTRSQQSSPSKGNLTPPCCWRVGMPDAAGMRM